MLLPYRYCPTWISHVLCCLYAILCCSHGIPILTATRKKPSYMGKQCELRSAMRSTWEYHVGKACCKIMQNLHTIPCKCTLCGPRNDGIPMSAVRAGGALRFRGFGYMEFPCKELAKNGITWNSHVRSLLAGLQAPLHGIPMWGTGCREGLHGNSHVDKYLAFLYMAYPM